MLVTIVVFAAALDLKAGDLDTLRTEVRREDAPPADERKSHHCDHDDDDCDAFERMLGEVFGWALLAPWWVPNACLEQDAWPPDGFVAYPYFADHTGLLAVATTDDERELSPFSGRLSIEHGADFNDLSRTSGRLIWESMLRLGVDTEWDFRSERLGAGGRDHLGTGDFNVIVRFAQSDWAQFHSGLGFNWLADRSAADFGFNFTYGVDLFPRRPWVVSATLDAGTLGASSLVHGRGSVGVLWRGVELYSAYDVYRVGRFTQHGPAAGVRVWW